MQQTKKIVTLYVLAVITLSLMILTMLFLKYPMMGDAGSAADRSLLTLNGPWKFKTGDSLHWADPAFNDTAWETVDLTAPPGAHDGDVGLSGYIPGWTSKGYPSYAGYAWYRIRVPLDSITGNSLALAAPPAVDDAWQLFIDGTLSGSAGDFSGKVPVSYSSQPRMILLPETVKNKQHVTLAFRVWMSAATLNQGPDLGGIHIAPVLGERSRIEARYNFQWEQTIKGYIVEIAEPVMFILLAIAICLVFRKQQPQICKWFVPALILLGLVRANQAVYFWWQIESNHQYDIITAVLLRPLILGSWLMAWNAWFAPRQPGWIPRAVAVLTLIYIVTQLFGLPWISEPATAAVFQKIADYSRFLFIALLLFIVVRGFVRQARKEWWVLLAILLVSVGLFSQEFALLHLIPGIWFPYGVGVSRTQYVYAGFVMVMYVVLIVRRNSSIIIGQPDDISLI